jgi:hypothetical protein
MFHIPWINSMHIIHQKTNRCTWLYGCNLIAFTCCGYSYGLLQGGDNKNTNTIKTCLCDSTVQKSYGVRFIHCADHIITHPSGSPVTTRIFYVRHSVEPCSKQQFLTSDVVRPSLCYFSTVDFNHHSEHGHMNGGIMLMTTKEYYWIHKTKKSFLGLLSFQSPVVSSRTTRFNIQKFNMVLALRCVSCADIRTATFALYIINWLVFITLLESVYSAVRTDSLYKADYV